MSDPSIQVTAMFNWFSKKRPVMTRIEPTLGVSPRPPTKPSPKLSIELTADAKARRLTPEVRKEIKAQSKRIPGLTEDEANRLYQAALEAETGQGLSTFVQSVGPIKNLTQRQIADIGIDMTSKISAMDNRVRMTRAGVTRATWLESGGEHCGTPENRALHRSLSGKRYSIKEGLKVNGRRIWPGMEDGCRCIAVPEVDP